LHYKDSFYNYAVNIEIIYLTKLLATKEFMSTNWISAFNRLYPVIDKKGDTYFSGPSFIKMAQQVTYDLPDYQIYIDSRNRLGKSSTRRVFYWDIIESLTEDQRYDLFRLFIESLEPHAREEMNDLKEFIFGGSSGVPKVNIPAEFSSAEKLSRSLAEIDKAIESGEHNRAVTMTYTCLEGLYKAYINKNLPESSSINDLLPMAKLVKNDILDKVRGTSQAPEQIINSIPTITNAIANSRNSFSDSHFDQDAQNWLSVYTRDLTNSIGRLLLHFI
jgi:hypothetical protein